MSRDTLLAPAVGVPLAIVALLVLLAQDAFAVLGASPRLRTVLSAAATMTVAVLLLVVVSRFIEYA